MRGNFDVIVLGVGGVGCAALHQLASRGQHVLGVDRFAPGHDRGSSHGETRVIRKAYFEHPDYVPLLNRAYELWAELEESTQTRLFHRVGLLEIGPPDGILIQGIIRASNEHSLPLEHLTERQVGERFPGFVVPPVSTAVYEADAGFLMVEECIKHYAELAQQAGAKLSIGESVREIRTTSQCIEVICDSDTFRAQRVVVTVGAWASQLLGDLQIPFRILRKHLHWYAHQSRTYQTSDRSPAFFYETSAGCYYGFPSLGQRGVKVAEHTGGETVSDPLKVDRRVDLAERARVESFLKHHLPNTLIQPLHHSVCMYTMSPDEHFVVGKHVRDERIVLVAGLSGHGFKFASVLGEVLADLAITGSTGLPVGFLAPGRFQT